MRLERDEFVVTFDATKIHPDDLIATIKKAGFASHVVPDSKKTSTVPTERVVSDDPVYVAALARAQKENKPLVIDFTATWCKPCQMMIRLTFPHPKVAPLLQRCIFLKIDTDKHETLSKSFGVAELPDIRFLTPDGTPKQRLTDFQDAESFAKSLQAFLKKLDSKR